MDGLLVDAVRGVGSVRIDAATLRCGGALPEWLSAVPVDSRPYRRQLADISVTASEAAIVLLVSRLFCDNIDFGKTFAEQVPWLAARRGRWTLFCSGCWERWR
ncbi:hypothetical protein [Nocardia salmonicida]|uniref:hypothetical protein n=1 Tax=Nocardia salmonicida TaxID=53431 RepID=UPI0007A3E0ED|nr:hypothetical protein [Nocardia salmonicida]